MRLTKTFFRKNFRQLFYLLAGALALTVSAMLKDNNLTKTKSSPLGAIQIEFTYDQAQMENMISRWQERHVEYTRRGHSIKITGWSVARRQQYQDFLFIALCVCMTLLLINRLFSGRQARILNGLLLTAWILAYIEDFFILKALNEPTQTPVWQIWLPASSSFLLLGIVLVSVVVQAQRHRHFKHELQKLSSWLSGAGILFWKFRIVFIGLLVIFLILWASDQGQDLLLIVNASFLGAFIFILFLIPLALINWYLPKYYDRSESDKVGVKAAFTGKLEFSDGKFVDEKLFVSRIFGAATFLVPAVCIMHAMKLWRIWYLVDFIDPMLLFLLLLLFYYYALKKEWIESLFIRNGAIRWKTCWIGAILVLAFILIINLVPGHQKPAFLGIFSLNLVLVSVVFIVFTTLRTYATKEKLKEVNISRYVLAPAILIAVLFVACNFFPSLLSCSWLFEAVTLPVVLSAIIFYTLIFSLLLSWGRRMGIHFITLLFLLGLGIALIFNNNFHEVRRARTSTGHNQRLLDYCSAWLKGRIGEIDSFSRATGGRHYPIFIVNAYGGGIRASAWTMAVVSTLDHLTGGTTNQNFQHYVFAYSSVSGGSTGCVAIAASRYAALQSSQGDGLYDKWKELCGKDYLTPGLVGLLGRDILMSSAGLRIWDDRAVLQEESWERNCASMGFRCDSPLRLYWARGASEDLPLLFANSYFADSGSKAIVAPVVCNSSDFPGALLIEPMLKDTEDLRLSTAGVLSARFPYISPSGKLDGLHHLLDGGNKDNSGGETAREILTVLNSVWRQMQKTDSSYKRLSVDFHLVSLPNGYPGTDTLQRAKNVFELTEPLTGAINDAWGNYRKAEYINSTQDSEPWLSYKYHLIYPVKLKLQDDDIAPVLPLGWRISGFALDEIELNLDTGKQAGESLRQLVRLIRQ